MAVVVKGAGYPHASRGDLTFQFSESIPTCILESSSPGCGCMLASASLCEVFLRSQAHSKQQIESMGSLNPISSSVEVTLRKFTLADMKLSLKWFGDDEVTVTTPNDSIRTEEELERYFEATIANHQWYRLICVNGVPAGAIYLTMGVGVHAVRGDLSYILAKEHWGKGVVTQATKMAVETGFKEFHLARIQAYVLTANIGSQRVLEKSGFQSEGLLRNFVKLRGTVVNVFVYGTYQDADMI